MPKLSVSVTKLITFSMTDYCNSVNNPSISCRSWVEEEAQRIQARAKFLAEAARRWNWNNSIESQDAIYNKRNNPESSS